MKTHFVRPCQTIALALGLCIVPSCGDHSGACPPCYFQTGANIAPVMNEPGTAKFVVDGTTLEGPLAFETGGVGVDGCFVGRSELNGVDGPTATSIPTTVVVYCQKDSAFPKFSVGVTFELNDLRDRGPGSYDLVAMERSWFYRGAQHNMDGTDIENCAPPGVSSVCPSITPSVTMLGLIIDEAVGSKEAAPANVSADFKRTAHLQFHLEAASTGHSLVVDTTVPFTQTAKEYEGANDVSNGCTCD